MDINTDPNYSRAMDPDMALSSISDLVISLALMVAQATQTNLTLPAWTEDNNIVLKCLNRT